MIIFISDSNSFLPEIMYESLGKVSIRDLNLFLKNLSEESEVIVDSFINSEYLRQIDFNICCKVSTFDRKLDNLDKYNDEDKVLFIVFGTNGITQYVKNSRQLRLSFSGGVYKTLMNML